MITGYRVTCRGKEVGTYRTIDEALVVARKRCPGFAHVQPVDAVEAYSRSFAGRMETFNTALRELRNAILRAFCRIP